MTSTSKRLSIIESISKAFLTWKRHHQRVTLPYGITLKQLYVLRQLERREILHPSEIAEMLYCDKPTASVVIKNMEKQGWIKRTPDPVDSRRTEITLEPSGRIKLVEIRRKPACSPRKSFDPLSCFTCEERAQLTKLLTKLNQHLKQLEDNRF